MIRTRMMPRAAGLVAAAALVVGLGGPAVAGDGHSFTVSVASVVPGWTVYLDCAADGNGKKTTQQAPASSLVTVQRAVFRRIQNSTCTVRATQPVLLAAGLAGSGSVAGVHITKDTSVVLTPALVGCTTACLPTATNPTPTSTPTPTPVAAAPVITGKPVVGSTITANAAAAPAGATITGYQWYVKRVVRGHQRTVLVRIKGGHHRALRMKERLAGKHVLVGVTYTLLGSRPTTVYSKALKVMKERMKE